ncbi:DUF4350 domain-containing protein [Lentibacillus jeotgali]|uniref:DUF4350 domain-containing protein n=1 Tax=Lentibacillus jeotgali TaxID=558169 RepID=UPI0002625886|nr:DUF4350 domain-containing protein [Lentibacillus jeotgali]
MHSRITSRRALIWLAAVLLLFIGISYIIAPDTPKEYPAFVSESPSPTGVKAFYTYMDNQTGAVNRWRHSPELLTGRGNNQLLIMVEPSFTPGTEEMEDYMAFMESGNTILLLKTNPDGMFGTETVPAQDASGDITDQNENVSTAEINSAFRLNPSNNDNILLKDEAGAIATKSTFENGALITAVAPEWMMNAKILEQDHLELILSFVHAGNTGWETVYFDEYLHRSNNAPSLTALYPYWILVLGFQAVLFAALWLWFQGKRFGPVKVPREETVRFSDERIQALAAWYQRSRQYRDSLQIQADYLKMLLQERWGIPYYKNWVDIQEQLDQKAEAGPDMKNDIDGLTNVLQKERIDKKTYMSWSKRINRLRKEVEGE